MLEPRPEIRIPTFVRLTRGQVQQVVDAQAVAKRTRPPPRLTDASLLTAMETAGKLVEDEELRDRLFAATEEVFEVTGRNPKLDLAVRVGHLDPRRCAPPARRHDRRRPGIAGGLRLPAADPDEPADGGSHGQ